MSYRRAMMQNGNALHDVSEKAKCDRAVVMEAVKIASHALQHACEMLKCDREVLMEAVT